MDSAGLCFRFQIPFVIVTVLLFELSWSSFAFFGDIHEAAKQGNLAKAEALLKDNANLVSSKDNNGYTALHFAAFGGHKDVADFLLAHMADVNAKNNQDLTPLYLAVAYDHKDVVDLLLSNKADVNAKDNVNMTPLHYAAQFRVMVTTRGYRSLGNTTPLHRETQNRSKDVTELLLAHGAEVNAKDNEGKTPLHYAVQQDFREIAELLRQHGGYE
jgi:ankyrin repeat protein